jgi:opacity protein-like surface antigen
MRTTLVKILVFTAIFIGLMQSTKAQGRWSAEFRPGFNIPVSDLGEENLGLGFGFEFKAAYLLMPHMKMYGGWSWNGFETDTQIMRNRVQLDETSFTFGAELRLPITEPPVTYFVRGSGVYGKIKLEDNQGNFNGSSNYGLGWQLGAGVEIALTDYWSIKPDLRYRSLSRDVEVNSMMMNVNLQYFAVGVGISGSIK